MKIFANVEKGRNGTRQKTRLGGSLALPSCGGFTMIEIAMSIGIIAFALVAIIGILPTGLTAQKDSRDDSIVNEDANFFMQAIRSGAVVTNTGNIPGVMGRGFDFLTNYVDGILVSNSIGKVFRYTNEAYPAGSSVYFSDSTAVSQGAAIVGLLSTPAFMAPDLAQLDNTYYPTTNYVRAWVRGLNGAASFQNGSNSFMAFRYVMDVQITPHSWFSLDSTNYTDYLGNQNPEEWIVRSNRWVEARCINRNLYDVELKFHWPVVSSGLGPNHQTYRSTVAGCVTNCPTSGTSGDYYYFEPLTFSSTNIYRPLE